MDRKVPDEEEEKNPTKKKSSSGCCNPFLIHAHPLSRYRKFDLIITAMQIPWRLSSLVIHN